MFSIRTRRSMFAAGFTVAALALTACSNGPSEDPGPPTSEEGVPYGASIEEWQAAFEDIEPITILTQVQGGPGSPNAAPGEAYWASVEE